MLYRNDSNSSIIRTHPLFQEKLLYSKHSNTRDWNYYSNIQTPTPCGAQTGVAKHLLSFDILCGARARVTKHLLAYYRHTTGVFEHLLDYYCHCGAQTGVVKSVLAFDSHCRARTGVAKCVLAFVSGEKISLMYSIEFECQKWNYLILFK